VGGPGRKKNGAGGDAAHRGESLIHPKESGLWVVRSSSGTFCGARNRSAEFTRTTDGRGKTMVGKLLKINDDTGCERHRHGFRKVPDTFVCRGHLRSAAGTPYGFNGGGPGQAQSIRPTDAGATWKKIDEKDCLTRNGRRGPAASGWILPQRPKHRLRHRAAREGWNLSQRRQKAEKTWKKKMSD